MGKFSGSPEKAWKRPPKRRFGRAPQTPFSYQNFQPGFFACFPFGGGGM